MDSEFIDTLISILKNWQNLLGAFLGAAIPISFWFYIEWYRKRKKFKEGLYYLEKLLVYNINAVGESHRTIKDFIKNRLVELIDRIDQATVEKRYAVHTAFLPLFSYPTDENLFSINTNSGYLDNKLLQIFGMTKDFSLAIDDLRNQFSSTVELNYKLAFGKLNGPVPQNNEYKKNIEEFIKVVERDLFGKNEKIYIKALVSTRVAVSKIRDIGLQRWRIKFSPSFKFFMDNKKLEKFKSETFDRIDQFLKKEVDVQIEEINSEID